MVEEFRGNTRDKGSYMKLSVLVMLDEGLDYDTITILLGIGRGSITNYKQKYEAEGLDKYLDRHYVPYSGKLSSDQALELAQVVEERLFTTSREVADYIEQTFGVKYSDSAVRTLLHRLDFVYKKTSEVPGRSDAGEQAAYLTQFIPFLNETLETEVVFFSDAVHPQHNTRSSCAWIKKGQEKPLPTNSGRSRINLNGAMNAHQPEDIIVVESPVIDGEATIELYKKIKERHADKETIYIICDNARYYYSAKLQGWLDENPKIVQLFLPPYSPNLNLIERLWKFLRKKVINTKYYPLFQDFRRAILEFFDNVQQFKTELKSLITFNFQRIRNPVPVQ